MDERLRELLQKVQYAALDLGDAARSASQRAGEWLQSGKARLQAVELKAEANRCLREIGQMVYNTHIGTPTESEELFKKLKELDELNERIAELERQWGARGTTDSVEVDFVVQDNDPVHCCPTCGMPVKDGDRFCRECGEGLE